MRKNLALMSVLVMFVLSVMSVNADSPPTSYDGYCYVDASTYVTDINYRPHYGSSSDIEGHPASALLFSNSGLSLVSGKEYYFVFDWSAFTNDYPGVVGQEGTIGARANFWTTDGSSQNSDLGWRADRRSGPQYYSSPSVKYWPLRSEVNLSSNLNPMLWSGSNTKLSYLEVALPCALVPTPTPTPLPTYTPTPTATSDLNSLECADQVITIPMGVSSSFDVPTGYSMSEVLGATGSGGGLLSGAISLELPYNASFDYTIGLDGSGGVATFSGDLISDLRIGFCSPAVGTPVPTPVPTFTPAPGTPVPPTPTPLVFPTPQPTSTSSGGGWVLPTPMPMGDAYSFNNAGALEFLSFFVTFLHAMGIYWPIVISMMLMLVISVVFFFIKRAA